MPIAEFSANRWGETTFHRSLFIPNRGERASTCSPYQLARPAMSDTRMMKRRFVMSCWLLAIRMLPFWSRGRRLIVASIIAMDGGELRTSGRCS